MRNLRIVVAVAVIAAVFVLWAVFPKRGVSIWTRHPPATSDTPAAAPPMLFMDAGGKAKSASFRECLQYHADHPVPAGHKNTWTYEPKRWNQDDRWLPLSLKRPCSVLYVGGNTDGADGKQLRDTYGCHIHTFEPVTPFFESLQRLFGQDREGYSLYAYGWANSDRSIEVDALAGQSTTLTEGADKLKGSTGTEKSAPVAGGGKLTLQLRDAVKIVEELMPGTGPIDLLHMNCEGCEFEALERLLDAGVISRFNVIQFGSHFESHMQGLPARFCRIQELLRQTHRMDFGMPFAWERWTKL